MDFEIKEIERPDKESCTFAVCGRLDTNASPKLADFADDLYKKGIRNLVVDMEQCVYIASAGLRVVVSMQKQASTNGSLVFKNVQDEVMEVFEMTGFNNILTFE